uniref:DNA (cytosine-5-)-methyltransferase n=1 Tax=Amphiprion ocellaris TaxID=80972 RepID=A0A3Q1CQ03_AMPOC
MISFFLFSILFFLKKLNFNNISKIRQICTNYIHPESRCKKQQHLQQLIIHMCLYESAGAAYCQLMDWLFPGSLDFSSVQFQSDDIELASVHNLSLLKTAFSKIGVNKYVPSIALMRWGFTVSLDFLQWFKLFFDRNNKGREYHALEARGGQSLVCAVPGMYQCTTSHRSSTHILHMDTATPAAACLEMVEQLKCVQKTPIKREEEARDDLTVFIKRYCCDTLHRTDPEDIVQACSDTPYCLYLYVEVELSAGKSSNIVLIGYVDQSSGVSVVRPLHALQMSVDVGPQISADREATRADSDAHLLVEAVTTLGLPLSNLAVFYCDAPHPTSRAFASHLRLFNPRFISVCGLSGMAGRACHAGLQASFSNVVDLVGDIYHYYSSCSSVSGSLKELFAGAEPYDLSRPVSSQCLFIILTVQKMVGCWRGLVDYFKSLQGSDAALIRTQLMNHEVQLHFLFLSHALEPLRALQELHQCGAAGVTAELQLTSSLLNAFAASVLQPSAAERFLRKRDADLLQSRKYLLPPAEVAVGSQAKEFLWATPVVDLGEQDRIDFLNRAQRFYRTVLGSLVESIPELLSDVVLRNIGLVNVLLELAVQLGLCGAGSPGSHQLETDYLSFSQAVKEEQRRTNGEDLSQAKGELVWVQVDRFPPWPGVIVPDRGNTQHPSYRMVQWFGREMPSWENLKVLKPFAAFDQHFSVSSFSVVASYKNAVSLEAALRCKKKFSAHPEDKDEQLTQMLDWAFGGFRPSGPDGLKPTASLNGNPDQNTNHKNIISTQFCVFVCVFLCIFLLLHLCLVSAGYCLCCGTDNVEIFHPLFKGSLCLKCKNNFTETLFRYDEDGYQSYCTICCYGLEVILCGNNSCCRSFCEDCLNILVGSGTFASLKLLDPWICYLCQPHRPHGALVPREDWSIRVQEQFANNSAMEFEPHRVYPSIPANLRRPVRVLSLFDGIATGYLVLKDLGFKVEKYVASEVCEDSLAVGSINHDRKIIHVGDVRLINQEYIDQWGPFDLLIGGSPCNDLSIVNPIRKGLYEGTGRLFFEYYRILQLLKPKEDDPRPFFWLFENVVFMNTHDKVNICRFLECNPVLVDAVKVSPAHRARYFWGNIPGMSRPIIASQKDKLNLQDCLEIGREARVTKVRTITTNPNSLKQGKNVSQLPVLYNGKEDTLWITELEKIFGFPKHYTDVRNMNRQQRQKVLGKAWSVPVIRHLFAPLKDYFACEELPPMTNSSTSFTSNSFTSNSSISNSNSIPFSISNSSTSNPSISTSISSTSNSTSISNSISSTSSISNSNPFSISNSSTSNPSISTSISNSNPSISNSVSNSNPSISTSISNSNPSTSSISPPSPASPDVQQSR